MIEFKRLGEVSKSDICELLNHPLVRRHMPLALGPCDDEAYKAFIIAKEELWQKHGYGPWAFYHEGKFIGWGGLQYEEGDADLALVLHPKYWGMAKAIYDLIIEQAFGEMGLESITALLPPSRTSLKVMQRLGFKPDGELIVNGHKFLRFRLTHRSL